MTGTWDDEHVKALLHFPRFPIRLIQEDPWQTWIGERGGLKAVYDFIKSYPFSPSHRRILDVVLSNPEAVSDVYASQLNISRATYFYQLRDLVPALIQAFNQWELVPAANTDPSTATAQSQLNSLIAVHPTIPIPLTNLIGAEAQLRKVTHSILREEVRLLTLLGPGGIGKTRLAIELARHLTEHYGPNVCFVDLAEIKQAQHVGEIITQALGLKGQESTHLKAYLRTRSFLLILDNFEHLLPASELVSELLAAAPHLNIVVTSRAPLHIYGEHQYIVRPLDMPDTCNGKDLTLWSQSPAVSLFVQRAQAVNPGFVITNENLEVIAELCLHMEGVPLTIELTAFQTKYFSPQAILVRLSNAHYLNFLSQGPGHLPLHQQNIRAMHDWSYSILSSDLQILFAGLAVFPSGFSISAAESVCTALLPKVDIQIGLTALANQSMLEKHSEANGEPRFRMLSITREYALERLEETGKKFDLQMAHAKTFLEFVENCAAGLQTESQENSFTLLCQESANLKIAIQWCIDHLQGELGLRFIVSLWHYWRRIGDLRRGSLYAQAILEFTTDLKLTVRTKVLRLVGWLAFDVRNYTTMLWTFQNSLDLSRSMNDEYDAGLALHGLGELACLKGQYEQSNLLLEEAQQIFNQLNNGPQMAWSYHHLGQLQLCMGKLSEAQAYFEKSLLLFREKQSDSGFSVALASLGQCLFYRGLGDQAAPLFDEAVSIYTISDRHISSGKIYLP
ncbi:MAG: tetratricopeptide repeat protein [Anaerolineaceae bacterium]|nr:tetratricopeptide repeat protein [Anaerolineaceae bacterium]